MGRQMTEMLKGTLEGIVPALLAGSQRTGTKSRRCSGRRASPIRRGMNMVIARWINRERERLTHTFESITREEGTT
jgi:hypothetical protein